MFCLLLLFSLSALAFSNPSQSTPLEQISWKRFEQKRGNGHVKSPRFPRKFPRRRDARKNGVVFFLWNTMVGQDAKMERLWLWVAKSIAIYDKTNGKV